MANVSNNISAAAPYYDDYVSSGNEDKNYLRILFKPGIPVQTRELNQLQTALQNQIAKVGTHLFKDNSRVLDGELFVDKNLPSIDVDMASGYQSSSQVTSSVVGQSIEDAGDTLSAKVVAAKLISGTTWKLFLRYTKATDSASISSSTAFTAPDYTKELSVGTAIDIGGTNIGTIVAVGYAARYKINSGVYFTKGSFVKVEEQIVYLDTGKDFLLYDSQPILRVVESSITSSTDTTLRDNASGTTNLGAPGADRYKIDLQLKVLTDNPTILGVASNTDALSLQDFDSDAIKLADVQNGDVLEPNDYIYNEIGEVLAKRTFEESGNYVVRPFRLDIREHRDDGANRIKRGKYTAAQGGDSSKIAVDIEPSVAYVQGKRRELISKKTVAINKARDTFAGTYGAGTLRSGFETVALQVRKGNYIEAATIFGIPDPSATCEIYQNIGDADSPAADTQAFGSAGMDNAAGESSGFIGTCKVSSVHYTGSVYKVYINTIVMIPGFQLSDASYLSTSADAEIPGGRASDYTFAARLNADGLKGPKGFVLRDVKENTDIFPIGRTAVADIENLYYCINSQTTAERTLSSASSVTLISTDSDVPSTDRFYSVDNNDYIVVDDSGNVVPLHATTAPALSNADSNGLFRQVVLTFATAVSDDIKVMYSSKVKADLTNGKKTQNGNNTFNNGASNTALATNQRFSLSTIDVFEIVSVTHGSDDVTKDFKLIDGRTPTAYGTSYVVYTGAARTTAALLVTYKKFTHSTSSAPFTVESYYINGFNNLHITNDSIDYENLYPDGTVDGMKTVADGIDFRAATISLDPNSVITLDVNYFLPRIDRLFIDKNGEFSITEGKSAIEPIAPPAPKESLLLYDLNLAAYTFDHGEVEAIPFKNKRYTMKDIGLIDERLKSLEYYTALSLLEKDAEGRQIFDDEGLRFNNGILVDNFSGHGIGNPSDAGYKCAVDSIRNFLRPSYSAKNIGLYMGGSAGRTPSDSVLNVGETKPEPSLRLPATEKKVLVEQPYASTAISVNPFELAAYFGDIELTPSSDEWKSIDRRPDIITNMEDNLDSIISLAEESGVIGTFWNEWETNWSGWDYERGGTERRLNSSGKFIGLKRTDTYTREGERSREGLMRTANINEVEQDLGDKVVDVSFIPFIRSRRVYFKATGFKPNMRLIPFFDGVNIDIYTRSATTSDYEANTYADVSSRPSMEPEVNDSPAGFMSSEVGGTPGITTDSTGTAFGYFTIPNNDKLRFRTGDRVFKLIDSENVDDANATTFGEVVYTAKGLLQSVERNIISTRQMQIDTTRISERQELEERQTNTVYWDPLAQSFLIGEYKQGVFVRDIDLYFKDVDTELPVSIRLVKVENGIPTQKIIPGSKVSKTATEMVGQGSQTASIATNFRFDQPIYLAYGQEYAIIVLSNSPNYTMWHSEVGGTDVSTGVRITKNPYAGVSFVSQNASTWTPNQDTDYKMKINYLEFSQEQNSSVEYDFTAILPQDKNGTSQHTDAASALNATGMVLLAEDVRPQGTTIQYSLSLGDGKIYNMEPGKLTYFDGAVPATGSTVGGYNITSGGDIRIKATLTSTNKLLTPMIDLDRLSVLAISNVINNDSTNETKEEHGSATARYITRKVKLKNASTALDVYVGVNRPAGTNIEVYGFFDNKTNLELGDSKVYQKLAHSPIPINDDYTKFPEVNFRHDFGDVINDSTNSSAIEEFTEFNIKIVMLSDQSQKVPTVKELRCIATV